MRAGLIIITVTSLFGNPIGKLVQSSLNWFNYISYKLTSNIFLVFQCSTCSITCWRVCVCVWPHPKGKCSCFARARVLQLQGQPIGTYSSYSTRSPEWAAVQVVEVTMSLWNACKQRVLVFDDLETKKVAMESKQILQGRRFLRRSTKNVIWEFGLFVYFYGFCVLERSNFNLKIGSKFLSVGNVFRWSWLTRWPHRPMVTIGTWLKQWICCERVPSPLLLPKDKTNKQQLATKD